MQLPIKGNYIQCERFRSQIEAKLPLNKRLWQIIIREKVIRQGKLLQKLHGDDHRQTIRRNDFTIWQKP